MIRILLCCAGGMSTSLLVTKMEQAAQEKGIDLLLYKFSNGVNLINTIQVKMSRAYYNLYSKYQGMLWYNKFEPQDNGDWFIQSILKM